MVAFIRIGHSTSERKDMKFIHCQHDYSTAQTIAFRLIAFCAFATAMMLVVYASTVSARADDRRDEKKKEAFKVTKLTQGMGLYSIGAVSPDGKSILLLGQKPDATPNLYVMDLTNHSIRPPLTAFKWGVTDAAWSPDGQSIAFAALNETASFPEIFILDLKAGKQRQLTKNSFSDKEPVFTPDGKRLLYTSDESPLPDAAFGILHVAAIPVGGGKAEFFTEDEVSTIHPGIAIDGKSALLVKVDDASGRHSLWQYSFDRKPQRDLTGRKFARIHRYILNPSQQTMVLWAQEEPEQQDGLYILDLKTGDARELPEPDLPKRNPTLSPDGKLIAFVAPTPTGAQLFLYDSTSGQIQQLTYKGARNYSPAFVSNKEILFGSDRDNSNEIYLLDLAPQPAEEKKK